MSARASALPAIIANHLQAIREACARHSVSALAVVGSAARADFNPSTSDVDVLVDFVDGDVNYFRALMGLQHDLEAILGRHVDIITIRGIRNPIFLQSLREDAIPLFAAHAA